MTFKWKEKWTIYDFQWIDCVVVADYKAPERVYRTGERVIWPAEVKRPDWLRPARQS